MQEQDDEQRALLLAAQRENAITVDHLERTEDSEVQWHAADRANLARSQPGSQG
jgi:hypothetical protein